MPTPKKHSLPIPHSHAQRWLLAYDIRDPKRLQRVWRYLRQEGVQVQYSVYLLTGTRLNIESIIQRLRALIDRGTDDVRIYPLTDNTKIWGLGHQFDDSGNTICDAFFGKLKQSGEDCRIKLEASNTSSAFCIAASLVNDTASS